MLAIGSKIYYASHVAEASTNQCILQFALHNGVDGGGFFLFFFFLSFC